MSGLSVDATVLWNLVVAALGGLAVGIERQSSARGPHARFAGIRTFTMLGLGSGLTGWLWASGVQAPALIVLAGFVALTVAAYVRASRGHVDGTTEVAALVVIAACMLAGAGLPRLGSGVIAITTLLLVEKKPLHGWVRALDTESIRASARFAVMAVVILPLLPAGPFGPGDVIRPRLLWALVLFFSGLSFLGVLVRRIVGPGRGYMLAGLLGGLVSSTSVTLTYSRLSRNHPEVMRPLAAGALAANAVLLPRILVATSLLARPLAHALWPMFVAPFVIAMGLALRGWRQVEAREPLTVEHNPLQLRAAIEMALVFQVVLFGVAFATKWFGQAGIYGSAALLGLVDMDALTLSMADLVTKGTPVQAAASAIVLGVIANTVVKMTMALVIGRGRFRILTAAGLAAVGIVLGVALAW